MTSFLFISFILTSLLNGKEVVDFASELAAAKKVKIPIEECQEMERKMGQLMYVNVDGFGSKSAIDPAYLKLVKKLQIGGVLPHYSTKNYIKVKEANETLQKQTDLPLLIGADYVKVESTNAGLGVGPGLMRELGDQDTSCFEKIGKVEAALHKILGVNNPLGPTVEYGNEGMGGLSKDLEYKVPRLDSIIKSFKEMGLETTIKHFPYTPADYNLHKDSPDTNISEERIDKEYMPIYRELKGKSGMLMTTHLYNSKVDPNNVATFSKKWMKKLREEIGFKGLVMTDGLFMMEGYSETMKLMSRDFPLQSTKELKNDYSIFAVKAILAGHDMFFLETSSKFTENVWKNLVSFSCSNLPQASEFRDRVRESYDRIVSYKKQNPQLKMSNNTISNKRIEQIIALRGRTTNEICNLSSKEIDKLLGDLREKPTSFSCDDGCSPSPIKLISVPDLEVDKLESGMVDSMPTSDIVERVQELNGDELNKFISQIKMLPNKMDQIRKSATALLKSSDPKKRDSALETLTLLDLWQEDNSYLLSLIRAGDHKKIENYAEFTKKGKLPTIGVDNLSETLLILEKIPLERYPFVFESLIPPNITKKILEIPLSTKARIATIMRVQDEGSAQKNLNENEMLAIIKETSKFNCITDTVNNRIDRICGVALQIPYKNNSIGKWSDNGLKELKKIQRNVRKQEHGVLSDFDLSIERLFLQASRSQKEFVEFIKYMDENRQKYFQLNSDFESVRYDFFKIAIADLDMALPTKYLTELIVYMRNELKAHDWRVNDPDYKKFILKYKDKFPEIDAKELELDS